MCARYFDCCAQKASICMCWLPRTWMAILVSACTVRTDVSMRNFSVWRSLPGQCYLSSVHSMSLHLHLCFPGESVVIQPLHQRPVCSCASI